MSDYIEWDGTEECLEVLMVWWGTRIGWEHSPDCDGESLCCCEGVTEYISPNTLRCSTPPWEPLNLMFGDVNGDEAAVEIGDKICYRGEGLFELVKNA